MLKVVVYDGGYGGELFSDKLEESLPILEVVRVIDWRNAEKIQASIRSARKAAKEALRPYIGKVDLIIFANYLLASTSLRHFRRKYKNQKFAGLTPPKPAGHQEREIIILTTKALTHTVNYHNYLFRLNRKNKTMTLDTWPAKIDDGELEESEIYETLVPMLGEKPYLDKELVLACSQFSDTTDTLRGLFGKNLKIYDGFDDAITGICKTLKIRGRAGKKN